MLPLLWARKCTIGNFGLQEILEMKEYLDLRLLELEQGVLSQVVW
jgi:hypothetical protein